MNTSYFNALTLQRFHASTLQRLAFISVLYAAVSAGSAVAQIRVLPPDEVAARVPVFTEVNFENVNLRNAARIARTDGVVVRRSALQQCNTCPLDPGDTNGGNIQLVLRPGAAAPNRESEQGVPENAIRFVLLPRFIVWEIADDSPEAFAFRVTDGAGRRYVVEGASVESPFGIESAYGFRQMEVASVEGAGPMKFPRIFIHNVPPPLRLIARPAWSTQVNLTWRYSDLGHDAFQLERSETTRSNFVAIATLPPDARSYQDVVEPGGRYFYRLRANHPNGESAYSADATARTGGRETNFVFRSVAAEDGSVCENLAFINRGEAVSEGGDGGDAILIGDLRRNQQCKGFLSFDTSSIPDGAEIVSAVLQLRQGSRQGDAFSALGPLYLDMSGADGFGDSAELQAGDFEAGAGGVRVARIARGGNNIHRIVLDRRARALINKAGRTQFRLSFAEADNNNFAPDNVGFFSGEAARAGLRPALEVQYRPR